MYSLYRKLDKKEILVIFVDPAEGGDFSAMVAMSKKYLDIPMVYHAKTADTTSDIGSARLGNEASKMGKYIQKMTGLYPYIAVERNTGQATIARLLELEYPRIWRMKSFDLLEQKEEERFGWTTNKKTRPKMLDEWAEALAKREVIVYDEGIIKEHLSFIRPEKKPNHPEAITGKHDDLVIACFTAKTKILTSKGQVDIEKIKKGDMVLTRGGFQPVVNISKRKGEVVKNLGLIGTANHPIFTEDGVKELNTVADTDILYMWNEKQSFIEKKSIIDILNQRDDNSGFISGDTISGNNHQWHFIDKFGLITLEKYLMDMLFIIKTIILLIIKRIIWNFLKRVIIVGSICFRQKEENSRLKQARNKQKGLFVIWRTGEKIIKNWLLKFIVKVPLKILYGQHHIKQFALDVVKHSIILVKMEQNIVQNYVEEEQMRRTDHQDIKKRLFVYNLTVANYHEYFANNILVHNCSGAYQVVQTIPSRIVDKIVKPIQVWSDNFAKLYR